MDEHESERGPDRRQRMDESADKHSADKHSAAKADSADASELTPLIYDSASLFQGRREVIIQHAGQSYRIRLTRAGKLHLLK